jgi:hypothetical protein
MLEARAARKRVRQDQGLFGSFGAIREEAQLRGDAEERDPRWEERRMGDSDVDWGDGGGAGWGEGESESGMGVGEKGKWKGKQRDEDGGGFAEGMDLDPELELDVHAMKRFVWGMREDGQRFVTMDDIADVEMMRREDDDDGEGGSSADEDEPDTEDEEIDTVINAEEDLFIAELGGTAGLSSEGADDEDDEDEDDEDSGDGLQSPRSGFKTRLERLRRHAREELSKNAGRAEDVDGDGDGDDDDLFEKNLSWAEADEDYIAHIQARVVLTFCE